MGCEKEMNNVFFLLMSVSFFIIKKCVASIVRAIATFSLHRVRDGHTGQMLELIKISIVQKKKFP